MQYLTRYESGDVSAWDDLVADAADVVGNEDKMAEAAQVARALMRRVQANISVLRKNLEAAGCALEPEGKPLQEQDYDFITKRFGPLPVSLNEFYTTLGSISLAPVDYDYGDNALESRFQAELVALDPLMVYPISELRYELDHYDASVAEEEEEENPFRLILCPDFLHKADVSGGSPYSVCLPATNPEDKLDPLVQFDDHESMTFVTYLRQWFKWGGFWGLSALHTADENIGLNRMMPFGNLEGDWRPAATDLLNTLLTGLVAF